MSKSTNELCYRKLSSATYERVNICVEMNVSLFSCRREDEIRRSLEQEAQQARQHELEQVSRLEEQRKKREEFQR